MGWYLIIKFKGKTINVEGKDMSFNFPLDPVETRNSSIDN